MGGFENFFKDLGRELESAFEPDKILDALNPLNTVGQWTKTFEHTVDTVGGVVDRTVGSVTGSFNNLINFLPMILIGAGSLFLLTKKN